LALRRYQPEFPVAFIDLDRDEDTAIRSNSRLDHITIVGLIFKKHIFDNEHDINLLVDQLVSDLVQVEEHQRSELLKSVFVYLMRKGLYNSAPLEKIMDILPESQKNAFRHLG